MRLQPARPLDRAQAELEHRDLEKYGDKAEAIRASLDSPDGWNGALAFYAAEAAKPT